MKKSQIIYLDFFVDKLTNSIENIKTGDSFRTSVSLVTKDELKDVSKKSGWAFDWKSEFKAPEKEVYKLTIAESSNSVIQDSLASHFETTIFTCT